MAATLSRLSHFQQQQQVKVWSYSPKEKIFNLYVSFNVGHPDRQNQGICPETGIGRLKVPLATRERHVLVTALRSRRRRNVITWPGSVN